MTRHHLYRPCELGLQLTVVRSDVHTALRGNAASVIQTERG